MKRALILLAVPMLLVAAACDQQPAQKDQPVTTAPTAQPTIADEDLAVPADFEEEASKTITVASYKSDLEKIDAEIAAN